MERGRGQKQVSNEAPFWRNDQEHDGTMGGSGGGGDDGGGLANLMGFALCNMLCHVMLFESQTYIGSI